MSTNRAQSNYDQPTKRAVRADALKAAVEALTTRRNESCSIRQTYVREARDQLRRQGGQDREQVDQLKDEHIRAWEGFHRSEVSVRGPSELTIAYLGGPDPTADFETLVRLGVQPHNIWVFEADRRAFDQARRNVSGSDFQLLKLIHGSMEGFFETVPRSFDIVYFDACGPLPSTSQRTLRTLVTMMRHQRLRSPGVLLTNFAEAGKAGPDDVAAYAQLIAAYLYPKRFLEGVEGEAVGVTEGASAHGLDPETFHSKVSKSLSFFYGQFVTRLLIDLGAVLVPARRLANSTLWKRLFTVPPAKLLDTCLASKPKLYDYGSEDWFPLTAFLDGLLGGKGAHLAWVPGSADSGRAKKLASSIANEVDGLPSGGFATHESIRALEAARNRPGAGWTPEFQAALRRSLASPMFQFCDVPNSSLILDPVLGQIGYPYHCAPRAVHRWSYTAKQTEMFVDLLVMDECRYVYDWAPSMQLLDLSFADPSQQLVLRLALDGVAKQRRWYNSNTFYGTAAISQGVPGFEAETLSRRIAFTL